MMTMMTMMMTMMPIRDASHAPLIADSANIGNTRDNSPNCNRQCF